MPCLYDLRLVFQDESTNLVQLAGAETMIPRQIDGCQPEFGLLVFASNVDMNGLVAIETEEEEPVRPRNAWNPRQFASLPGKS